MAKIEARHVEAIDPNTGEVLARGGAVPLYVYVYGTFGDWDRLSYETQPVGSFATGTEHIPQYDPLPDGRTRFLP